MNVENVEMIENVDEAMEVIDGVIPKKGFKLSNTGKWVLGGTIAAAVVTAVVAVVKTVCANKAKQEETEGEESDDTNTAESESISYSDVDDE